MSHLTAEQRTFDAWFRSQPKMKQAQMRREGIIPYREMPVDRYVFEVKPDAAAFMYDPWGDDLRREDDTFISRERVREILGRVLDTLARSPERMVRLHLELVRIALRTPDALSNGEICASYALTRQAVHYRVQEMRRVMFGRKKRNADTLPIKESIIPSPLQRGVPHRVEKTRTSPRKPSSLARPAPAAPTRRKCNGAKA